jgi:hypothetical protein
MRGTMKLSDHAAPDTPRTPAELRRRAERARDLANALIGDAAEPRLLALADDYERCAAELEAQKSSNTA